MPRTIEIPLYIIAIQEDGFHVFLEVKVNGHKLFMLLDTGASRTVFDLETIRGINSEIVMEENEDKATGLGSDSVDNYVAIIDQFEIGELCINHFETGIIDLSHVNSSYSRIEIQAIAGVLGSDILVRYDGVINYKKKTLKLTKGKK